MKLYGRRAAFQAQAHCPPGVPGDIGQGLLDHAIEGCFDLFGQSAFQAFDLQSHLDAKAQRIPVQIPLQGWQQAEIVQQGWPQVKSEFTDPLVSLVSKRARVDQPLSDLRASGGRAFSMPPRSREMAVRAWPSSSCSSWAMRLRSSSEQRRDAGSAPHSLLRRLRSVISRTTLESPAYPCDGNTGTDGV
jgi:hypothetical protein